MKLSGNNQHVVNGERWHYYQHVFSFAQGLRWPSLLFAVRDKTISSPAAAHPGKFCHLYPGHTDEKQLESIKIYVSLIRHTVNQHYKFYWMFMTWVRSSTQTSPGDTAVHSQRSLFVLLLRGSLAAAFLFFSLSSIGLKWAKVRINPLKLTWSSLKTKQRKTLVRKKNKPKRKLHFFLHHLNFLKMKTSTVDNRLKTHTLYTFMLKLFWNKQARIRKTRTHTKTLKATGKIKPEVWFF